MKAPTNTDPLPFWCVDVTSWLSDTQCLTDPQYTALHRLMLHAWRRGGDLPADTAVLARSSGRSIDELLAVWPAIEPWFVQQGDKLVPYIIADEYRRATEARERKRRGAARTNRARWGDSDSLSDTHSDSLQTQLNTNIDSLSDSQSSSSPSPSPSSSESPDTQIGGGCKGEPTAETLRNGAAPDLEDQEEEVLQGRGKKKPGADVPTMIRRLLEEGQSPDAVVKILRPYRVTLATVRRAASN